MMGFGYFLCVAHRMKVISPSTVKRYAGPEVGLLAHTCWTDQETLASPRFPSELI
jgi:hypothetical protein